MRSSVTASTDLWDECGICSVAICLCKCPIVLVLTCKPLVLHLMLSQYYVCFLFLFLHVVIWLYCVIERYINDMIVLCKKPYTVAISVCTVIGVLPSLLPHSACPLRPSCVLSHSLESLQLHMLFPFYVHLTLLTHCRVRGARNACTSP